MSAPQQGPQHPYGQQQPPYGQPYYPPQQKQRSVAGTTLKVLLTIGAVAVGLVILAVIFFVVVLQLT